VDPRAAVAAHTRRIHVGSGGVTLPNHMPFVVAEQFAPYPGRIDLGIGRAPGTDQATAAALRGVSPCLDGRAVPKARADAARRRTDRRR